MEKTDLSFTEIYADKEMFLQQYAVAETFLDCSISWDTLMEIGDDYETKCYGEGRNNQVYKGDYFDLIQTYMTQIASFDNVHSYRFRIKKTGSLLAKIIRKSAQRGPDYIVNKDNYYQEITDLLGIRILYVFKEDYWSIHQQLMAKYKSQLTQDVSVKLKNGDDTEMYDRLRRAYNNVRLDSNKTYRSIHYTIHSRTTNIEKCPLIEIQTRTIFEEGWSEINHKLVYKKGVGNLGLKKTSDVLSSMVGACDTIGMLMKTLYDTGVELNDDNKTFQNGSSIGEDSVIEVIRNFLRQ